MRRRATPPGLDGLAADCADPAVLVCQNRLDEAAALFGDALAHWLVRCAPDHWEVAANLHHVHAYTRLPPPRRIDRDLVLHRLGSLRGTWARAPGRQGRDVVEDGDCRAG